MTDKKSTVVVIGGGLGGLSAAVSLRQEGYQVTVVEKNQHLGGKVNRLESAGFGFDLGPSILTMPQIFEALFTKSHRQMKDYVAIRRLPLEWRSFFPDGTKIDLYGDLSRMARENPVLKAKDMEEYRTFLAYAKEIYDLTAEGYFAEGFDQTKDVLRHHGIIKALKGFDYFSTMQEAIDQRVSNPKLQEMLGYFSKYVGSSPYDAPAVLNMMSYMQHTQGIWYVPGGMHRLAEGIVQLAEEIGVTFITGQQVTKLDTQDQRITRAHLADGCTLTADIFVSNMEVIPAYQQLLTEEISPKAEKKFEPASSGFVLHLGVKADYPQLAHHNFFFSGAAQKNFDQNFHDHQLPEDPTIYLVNVNKTDPSQTKPGHENIKILPHIPYLQDTPFTEVQYTAFRKRILEKLERMGLTDLQKNIVFEDRWTPADIEANYLSHRGAIYGTVSDRKRNHGFKHPKHSERYGNLYFVGGTVNPGAGMPMVTLSGQQVSRMIAQNKQFV
ncbi:phytoene desaturase family protein [Enterococcus sp. DIV0876]|uniref:phytoene desaturase family protein n=1 Tax=Enterococcus sp. DIV0876 TaxID=2774633 RepID=UPI003D3006AA